MTNVDINKILNDKFHCYDEWKVHHNTFGLSINDFELTKDNIEKFNYLISLHNKDVDLYLWNNMNFRIDYEFYDTFDKSVFSKDSLEFIDSYIKAIDLYNHTNVRNYGNIFYTDRLAITIGNEKDGILLFKHLKREGKDSINFFLHKLTKDNEDFLKEEFVKYLNCYSIPNKSSFDIHFAVKLKDSNKLIGIVVIYQYEPNSCEIGYYIFKEYQRNGYAFEAVSKVVNELLTKGLKIPTMTKRIYVLRNKYFKPEIIRATPNSRNIPSVNLLKKLGFTYNGTIYKQRIDPFTKELLDVDYFYLEKN